MSRRLWVRAIKGPWGAVDIAIDAADTSPLEGEDYRDWLRERDQEPCLISGNKKPRLQGTQTGLDWR